MGRVRGYLHRVRAAVYDSFTHEHTPRQIALSFALGTFITMLPTFGFGLIVFVVLIRLFEWINSIALFSSVAVFNPIVKWGVYAGSFALGFLLLGPVDGFGIGDTPSFSAGSEIVVRLLVGNTILAVVVTVLAYAVVYRLVVAYQRNSLPVLEETVGGMVAELETRIEESDPSAEDS
ncbi:DUF2062 domain-containing protein [Halovenus sp. WSH3]|uniref:DUF2062 domain-containing protein n=1 Tax=Halovenus carboxidivorans TaxID=2692199 RepID=A0A6B0T813_9EURY|nr:DUF2062 domain-containing protein [Halovenus carboxidivorans]MXR51040.1 DUF2062 domain-containing protein [Halovenus carboxidivorans]